MKVRGSNKRPVGLHESEGMVDIDIPDEEFLWIAREAHQRDITFNHMFERIMVRYLLAHKDDPADAIRYNADGSVAGVELKDGTIAKAKLKKPKVCDGCGDTPYPNMNCDDTAALRYGQTKPKKKPKRKQK